VKITETVFTVDEQAWGKLAEMWVSEGKQRGFGREECWEKRDES